MAIPKLIRVGKKFYLYIWTCTNIRQDTDTKDCHFKQQGLVGLRRTAGDKAHYYIGVEPEEVDQLEIERI
jgi:hypothetical protein